MLPTDQLILRRIIISSGFKVFSLALSMGIGLFMTPFVIGILGKEDNGLFVLVGNVIGSIALLEMGLNSAVSRNIAAAIGTNDNKSLNEYYNSGFFLFAGIGFICFLIACFIALTASHFFQNVEKVGIFSIILVIVGLQFWINLPLRALSGLLSGSMRQDILSLMTMIFKLVSTAGVVITLLCGGRVISLALVGLTITVIDGTVLCLVATRMVPQAKINLRCVKKDCVKNLYNYSFFSFIVQIAETCKGRLSIFIITAFCGLAMVTVYDIAVTLTLYFSTIVILTVNLLTPVFASFVAQKKIEMVKKTLRFALKVTMMNSVFVSFGLIAWGEPFILRWLGEEFLVAYPPLVLLTLASFIALVQSPAVEYLYGTSNHHYHSLTCTVEALLLLVFTPLFAWFLGLFGAALSILICAVVVRCFIQPYFICKVVEITLFDYFQTIMVPFVKGVLCIILPAVFTLFFVQSNYPRLFLVGIVSTLLYFPPAIFLLFTADERNMVLRAMLKPKA